MKKIVLISLLLALSCLSFSGKAQLAEETKEFCSQFDSEESYNQAKKVVVLRNVGRSFAWSGAAIGLSGLNMFIDGAIRSDDTDQPGSGVEQVLGVLGIASGGALALVSLPFFLSSESKVSKYSSVLPNNFELLLTKDGNVGYTTIISAGLAVANCLYVSVNPGYSFTQNWFAGGGIEYISNFQGFWTARPFVNGRWTVSKSGVSPYVDFAFGYDVVNKSMLASPELGIRIKSGNTFAVTLGTKTDYYFAEGLMGLNLKLGMLF